ncbi:MAG: transposase, partial [archaeon]|nr:transposase [archaeon]
MFCAHETLLYCDSCDNHTIYGSEELLNLIAYRCSFGYDVMVYIGNKAFLDCRNYKEIHIKLQEKNIEISLDEIAYLAKKFIVYLAYVHRQSKQRIRNHMLEKGGYILHIDGTCEGDSPVLISALDGITEMVLENVKLCAEKSDEIIPFLRNIKERFGDPIATVSDMGSGILKAIKKVFPNIFIFICHFHFLRDIGKDLLGEEYDIIRKRLKKHGIQGALRKHLKKLNERVKKNCEIFTSITQLFDESNKKITIDISQITEEI